MPHSRLYSWSVLLRRLARIRWLEQFLHRASRSTAAEPPGRRRTCSDDHGRLDCRDCRRKRRRAAMAPIRFITVTVALVCVSGSESPWCRDSDVKDGRRPMTCVKLFHGSFVIVQLSESKAVAARHDSKPDVSGGG